MNDDVVQMTVDGQTYRYDQATGGMWQTPEQRIEDSLVRLTEQLEQIQRAMIKVIESIVDAHKALAELKDK